MADRSDRTVHARYEGMEIVRYDRSGKWYLEPTEPTLKRQHVTIRQAVDSALWGAFNGGQIHEGRLGGRRFDALVRDSVFVEAGE